MLDRSKYKRIPDLYVVGTEVVLKDGTPMWLQALNPFEADEARHDAAVARSRLTLALKEFGSDELVKIRGQFDADDAVSQLVNAKSTETMLKVLDAIRVDPDWTERLDLLDRNDELVARPAEDLELKLLRKTEQEYGAEVQKRYQDEIGNVTARLEHLDEDGLWEEYREFYLDQRGVEVALREYKLTELWYAARACDATVDIEGRFNHDACEGHKVRIFDTKAEVRDLPTDLQNLLLDAMTQLAMTERQAKNSHRQPNSSGSSPTQSVPEASTASIPDETLDKPLGISSPPSPTP